MSKKKSTTDKIGEWFIQGITDALVKRLRKKAEEYLRTLVKRLALMVIGIASLILGFIYIIYGIVQVVAIQIPEWAAFALVGVVLIGIGYALVRIVTK